MRSLVLLLVLLAAAPTLAEDPLIEVRDREIATLKAELGALRGTVRTVTEEKEKLVKAMVEALAERGKYLEEIETLKAEIRTLEADLEKVRTELAEALEQVDDLEAAAAAAAADEYEL